jgi:hypothetical protein
MLILSYMDYAKHINTLTTRSNRLNTFLNFYMKYDFHIMVSIYEAYLNTLDPVNYYYSDWVRQDHVAQEHPNDDKLLLHLNSFAVRLQFHYLKHYVFLVAFQEMMPHWSIRIPHLIWILLSATNNTYSRWGADTWKWNANLVCQRCIWCYTGILVLWIWSLSCVIFIWSYTLITWVGGNSSWAQYESFRATTCRFLCYGRMLRTYRIQIHSSYLTHCRTF